MPLPLGPYTPALTLPLGLTAYLEGDYVARVSVTPGYCARGLQVLAPGKPLAEALDLIERSCSFAGSSHRLAACLAVEATQNLSVSPQDALIRALFAEAERALARLWLLGRTARFAGFPQLWRAALDQREGLFDALVEGTGERQFWAVATPGGVREEIDWAPVCTALEALEPAVAQWLAAVGPKGPLGRATAQMGVIPTEHAKSLGVGGVVANGSGVASDARRTSAYDGYTLLDLSEPEIVAASGDVASRLGATVNDLEACVSLAQQIRDKLATASTSKSVLAAKPGAATVEGPHGPATVSLAVDGSGKVTSLAIETVAAATLSALDVALAGSLASQAPLIVASLDVCPECADL